MPLCASVKKKSSKEQCTAMCISGSILCGRHIKMKHAILWTDLHRDSTIYRFQALWRGWKLRQFFALCGPGVLNRTQLANDEDLVTCTEKKRQDPIDYFGVLENDKVWWFDFATMYDWSTRCVSPTNPYTRVPFTHEDLLRMHRLYFMRRRRNLPNPPECKEWKARILRRWCAISQVLRYYGFEDVHADSLANLNHNNLTAFFRLLHADLRALNKNPVRIDQLCMQGILKSGLPAYNFLLVSTTLIQLILLETKSYDVVFLVMSALYRC